MDRTRGQKCWTPGPKSGRASMPPRAARGRRITPSPRRRSGVPSGTAWREAHAVPGASALRRALAPNPLLTAGLRKGLGCASDHGDGEHERRQLAPPSAAPIPTRRLLPFRLSRLFHPSDGAGHVLVTGHVCLLGAGQTTRPSNTTTVRFMMRPPRKQRGFRRTSLNRRFRKPAPKSWRAACLSRVRIAGQPDAGTCPYPSRREHHARSPAARVACVQAHRPCP